jgi:uncharacterized protein YukE
VPDIKIDVEQLASAGRQVGDQAEDMAAEFLSADNRIQAAQHGWVGVSAAALRARMARWLPASPGLVGKVSEHGFALQTAAVWHAAAEAQRAQNREA